MKHARWAILFLLGARTFGQVLPSFDFTQSAGIAGWAPTHDIASLRPTTNGLVVSISGADPYLTGPARNYPPDLPLWVRLRLKSDQAGSCQIFYYTSAPTEAASVRFNLPAGRWVEGRAALPALGPNYRIRIDPPGTGGEMILASLRFETRNALPDFDFTVLPDAGEWGSPHDLQVGTPSLEGLPLRITGGDPYIFGPARNYPAGQRLWMRLRLKCDESGMAQLFYFQNYATEENSVRFYVPGGDWTEVRVPVPALGSNTRLRIDPPGSAGNVLLGRLSFDLRPTVQEPAWPKPERPVLGADALRLSSGDLTLVHGRTALGDFELRVADQPFAAGHTRALLGYSLGSLQRWVSWTNPPSVETVDGFLRVRAALQDPDGARWDLEQNFSAGSPSGAIEVETKVSVDRDRAVVFLPVIMVLPGLGTFGTNKTQALLAGVEYLENEPSSSEADIIGPASRRQVPDSLKLTFPMMALAADDRWLGLIWDRQPDVSVLHDTPDRLFNSGGHLMALIYPGADPAVREDGQVLPYAGQTLKAGQPLTVRATLVAGKGKTVVPALQTYVAKRGLPRVPDTGYSSRDYFRLAAHGWLDSQIRDGYKFRHAVGSSFPSAAVADAPMFMDWLAGQVEEAYLAQRLTNTARNALALVASPNYNSAAVGHIRTPTPALIYGYVAENTAVALSQGQAQLASFQPDGSVLYQAPSGGLDLGRTHWSREANGLTASRVLIVLERGVFSGNATLITEGLRLLRALNKFRDTVPRGAQTWEVPLHTPDVLASAYLTRVYTLGYELTGEADFLEQAKYWAWTGAPFIYLTPPNEKPVGVYSAIAVFGATHFTAPVWIGLPVQWCGLVYGDAIRRLARHDPTGIWVQLANGIAAAGVQHTHTLNETAAQGLLPDSYDLRAQVRNPVPINPATLLPEALQLFGQPPVYDFRILLHHGLILHAPGPLTVFEERGDRVRFRVETWSKAPSHLLVHGLRQAPRVLLDGVEVSLAAPHQYQSSAGRLILQISKSPVVEIFAPAKDALRIRAAPASASVRISWPVSSAAEILQSSDFLSNSSVWRERSGLVQTEGAERAYYTAPSQSAEFFRTIKPDAALR